MNLWMNGPQSNFINPSPRVWTLPHFLSSPVHRSQTQTRWVRQDLHELRQFQLHRPCWRRTYQAKVTEALRKYGLGSCGPAGFYGTIGVHTDLEKSIVDFLGTEDAIFYPQAFSMVSSVIPAFSKRGDIIVADRNINFVIQKGLQISRITIRWFDHNDMKNLGDVLESISKESKKRRAPLTRRFIITEVRARWLHGRFAKIGTISTSCVAN